MAATKEMPATGQQLLDLLDKATAADLADIDQHIAEHQANIDRLSAVRKLIDIKVNGKPEHWTKRGPKKPKAAAAPSVNGVSAPPPPAGSIMAERRKAIAQLLGKEGPMSGMVICNRLGIPTGSMTAILTCEWFKQSSEGYRLTELGRRESGI